MYRYAGGSGSHYLRFFLTFALYVFSAALVADDFEDGLAAFQSGDFVKARRLWESLAEQGDVTTVFNLGVMYAAGQGGAQDYRKAVLLYRQAADQGFAPAQFNLGAAYQIGQGVKKDPAEAAKWWRKAAKQGFGPAQYNLGTLYYFGEGVPQDQREVKKWLGKAAEQGDENARQALAALDKAIGRGPANGQTPNGALPAKAKAEPAVAVRRERWLKDQNPRHYTIQLFANWTEASILKFIDDHEISEKSAYFRVSREGRPWYSLVYGVYPTVKKAQQALAAFSPELRVMGPWVRRFREIQTLMRRGAVVARPSPSPTATPGIPDRGPAEPLNIQTAPPPTANAAKEVAASAAAAKAADAEQPPPVKREAWLLQQPSKHYTIQVFADHAESSVRQFVRTHKLDDKAAYFESRHEGRPWYSLVYGRYPDVKQARATLRTLSKSLQQWSPWIRSFGGIHKAIQDNSTASVKKTPAREVRTAPPRKKPPSLTPAQNRRTLARGQAAFNKGDYATALRLWRPLAEAGIAEAQYDLGFLYESGWGVERDYRKAVQWYRLAAKQNNAKAQFNLGVMQAEGRGIQKDLTAGMILIQQSAKFGHVKAQEFLADAYKAGQYGLPLDLGLSDYWSAKASPNR